MGTVKALKLREAGGGNDEQSETDEAEKRTMTLKRKLSIMYNMFSDICFLSCMKV
jgi:hypothetical protein